MNNIVLLLVCVLGCELVGGISGYFTVSSLKDWYKKLNKPSFNPPNAIFGPVWTILYALMGVSLYLVLISPAHTSFAITAFFLQLLLNFFWSFIFFSLKNLKLAFYEILLLVGMIILTMSTFWGVNHVASILLLPYLLWVSFATLLTYSIMKLNS